MQRFTPEKTGSGLVADPSSTSQMENKIHVSAETLQPIVAKHFDQISKAQWNTLAAGDQDSQVEQTIADMFTEMVQSATATVLRTITAANPAQTHQDDGSVEKISVEFGDSINVSFAVTLQLPVEKCESVAELTELVEKVVSEKVISLVSGAAGTPVWLEEPTVLVSSSMSSSWSLHKMVNYSKICLRKYLERMKSQCPNNKDVSAPLSLKVPSEVESERWGPDEINRAKISAATLVRAMNWMLEKGYSETLEVDEGLCSGHSAASETDHTEVEELQNSEAGASACSVASSPKFGMGLVASQSRDIVSSCSAASADTDDSSQTTRKQQFKMFAREQLERIARSFSPDQDVLGNALQEPMSSPELVRQCDSDECFLPGSAHGLSCPLSLWSYEEPRVGDTSTPTATSDEITESDFDLLFERLNRPPYFGPAGDETLNHMIGCEARNFAVKLTNKIYSFVRRSQRYQNVFAFGLRSFSDSFISDPRCHEDAPEVLCALTEDLVRKFLLKVLLWVEKSNQMEYADEVSAVVTDMDSMMSPAVTQLEEQEENVSMRTESSDASEQLSRASSLDENSFNDVTSSDSTSGSEEEPNASQEIQSPSVTASPEKRRTIWLLMQALLTKITSKVQSKRSKELLEPVHINAILSHLSERVLTEMSIPDLAVEKIHSKMKKLVKVLSKDLIKEFETQRNALMALAAREDPTFENAVVFHMMNRLNSLLTTPPKRSTVSRIFSAVRKLGTRA